MFIPSGAHTYSRTDMVFPANAPRFIVRAKGDDVWDENGKEYLDWGMGLRSVMIGHADDRINSTIKKAMDDGGNFTRPCLLECELAEKLCDITGFEAVKFGKNGSDATSAAVRIARAYTNREYILIAEENPFISTADWFIETTSMSDGTFKSGKTIKYSFDKLNFEELDIDMNKVACIILDPSTVDTTKDKLQKIRDICDKYGIVFLLDEIISGFRFAMGGVQELYGVIPDLSTRSKAMGNGYSISALCGKRDIMQLGDRKYGNTFLLSGTFFSETVGLSAALATINVLETVEDSIKNIKATGNALKTSTIKAIMNNDMTQYMSIKDHDQYGGGGIYMTFETLEIKTLFDQYVTARGVIMPYIAPSMAHSEEDLKKTATVIDESLWACRRAIEGGIVMESLIKGHIEEPVFK